MILQGAQPGSLLSAPRGAGPIQGEGGGGDGGKDGPGAGERRPKTPRGAVVLRVLDGIRGLRHIFGCFGKCFRCLNEFTIAFALLHGVWARPQGGGQRNGPRRVKQGPEVEALPQWNSWVAAYWSGGRRHGNIGVEEEGRSLGR